MRERPFARALHYTKLLKEKFLKKIKKDLTF